MMAPENSEKLFLEMLLNVFSEFRSATAEVTFIFADRIFIRKQEEVRQSLGELSNTHF